MGWSIGENGEGRDVGYGVPAHCDHPSCNAEIDRGLSHICGGEPDGGEHGCGLFFCGDHLAGWPRLCERCVAANETDWLPFTPKPDHPDWMRWKLRDSSWREWREKNPAAVQAIRDELRDKAPTHSAAGQADGSGTMGGE